MTGQGGGIRAWLDTAIALREQTARQARPGPWRPGGIGEFGWTVHTGAGTVEADDSDQGMADCRHIALHDPESVLRRCAADRKLLELHRPVPCGQFGCDCDQKCATCDWTQSQETGRRPVWGECDQHAYPCPTVRAIAEGYGWTGGER